MQVIFENSLKFKTLNTWIFQLWYCVLNYKTKISMAFVKQDMVDNNDDYETIQISIDWKKKQIMINSVQDIV